ncbi:MAG: hypothetical protein U0326_27515 [Polyangiales bacterium]
MDARPELRGEDVLENAFTQGDSMHRSAVDLDAHEVRVAHRVFEGKLPDRGPHARAAEAQVHGGARPREAHASVAVDERAALITDPRVVCRRPARVTTRREGERQRQRDAEA